jgi:hypothetical protein
MVRRLRPYYLPSRVYFLGRGVGLTGATSLVVRDLLLDYLLLSLKPGKLLLQEQIFCVLSRRELIEAGVLRHI